MLAAAGFERTSTDRDYSEYSFLLIVSTESKNSIVYQVVSFELAVNPIMSLSKLYG